MDGTRSFDLPIPDEWDVLSDLCGQMKATMEKRKIIRDRTLLDFSRMTVRIIRSAKTEEKLPSTFAALAEQADHYWNYQARNESDIRLGLSYARVYQITRMIKVFQAECERERRLRSALKQYKKNYQLLQYVYAAPGSTQKELSRALNLQNVALQRQTVPLEAEGFLSSYQLGCQTHYILPPAGVSLFKRMGKPMAKVTPERPSFSMGTKPMAYLQLLDVQMAENEDLVRKWQQANLNSNITALQLRIPSISLANNEVNNYAVAR